MTDPDVPLYSSEGLLASAIIENPQCYDEVRWLDADSFKWENVREVYVATEWVIAHHPGITSEELFVRVKNVLIEYHKHAALDLLVRMVGARTALGSEAPRYAAQVWTENQRRNLLAASEKMHQIVRSDLDLDRQVELIEETWVEALAAAHAEPGWRPIDGLTTVNEFVTGTDDIHEWVVPGLLERQERLMLVAPEKAGKSVFTRQVALMLAAGRHPFNVDFPIPPLPTLVIDLENPAAVSRRDFRRQVGSLDGVFSADNHDAYLWHKPSGLHLGDRADRLLMREVVERCQPALLCISPIYKAYDGLDQSWEQQAHGVQKPLDRLREEYNCALWLEHHAPWGEKGMREIRAIGSSRWARWLDYQVSLVPEGPAPYRRLEWRSVQRDERKMSPIALKRGSAGQPSWLPQWDDEYGFALALHEAEAIQ